MGPGFGATCFGYWDFSLGVCSLLWAQTFKKLGFKVRDVCLNVHNITKILGPKHLFFLFFFCNILGLEN